MLIDVGGAVRTHSFRAMGSRVDLTVHRPLPGATAWAAAHLRRMERSWSRFDPAAELVSLNQRAGEGPVRASAELRDAVTRALRLWQATDGCFDPTVLDSLVAAGYDRTFRALPRHRTSGSSRRPSVPTPAGVVVDDAAGTIHLPAGVRLDLGGLGKGLVADQLARGLVERGAAGACVSVGGDVAVAGEAPAPATAWSIPVMGPFNPTLPRWIVPLRRGAIVQSSRLVRRWTVGGEPRHHLIDPRTGTSAASGVTAVVVVADEAWWAEGVAKAALVAGVREGSRLVERLALGGWFVRDDGTVTLAGRVGVERAA